EIESLFIQRGLGGGLVNELKTMLRDRNVSYQQVPIEKLNRLTMKNHQGVVAFISPITYQNIEDIIPTVYENGEVPLILMLDGVTDIRNFGAIARTAECAGVHAIVVPKKGSAEINPDAIQTSAGPLFKIPVCRVEGLYKTAKFLQESGLQVIACTENTEATSYEPDYTAPSARILGSEEDRI